LKDLTGNGNVAACESNLQINYAHIYLRTDTEHPDEWYNSLVHELFHLVTSDYRYHAVSLLDYVENETANTKESNTLNTYYEQLIDSLSKIFCEVCPEETLL
jgi:hypothetical protein